MQPEFNFIIDSVLFDTKKYYFMNRIDILEIEGTQVEIVKNDFFTVKYMYLDAGKGMFSCKEQATATIQVIEGWITFVFGKEERSYMMPQNSILEFDGRLGYSIIAHENSKLLMTIVPIK